MPHNARMRIISWNCNMAYARKRDEVVNLCPDLVILQECSEQDVLGSDASTVFWTGSNRHKGLGVLVYGANEAHLDDSLTSDWPWFLPVVIDEPPVQLLAVWACVKERQLRYVRVMHAALDHYADFLGSGTSIAIGDFNSNAIWDSKYSERSHSRLVEKFARLEMVSAYHALTGDEQGMERAPTQYMYRQQAKPFHLDFAFVSCRLVRDARLEIGDPGEWLGLSDHMPLILDVRI